MTASQPSDLITKSPTSLQNFPGSQPGYMTPSSVNSQSLSKTIPAPSEVVDRVNETTMTASLTSLATFPPIDIPAQELRGAIIHFWHPWKGETIETIRQLVEEFNVQNEWGITVVASNYENLDVLSNEINQVIQDGQIPDLVVGYPHQALSWDQEKPLVDFNKYLSDTTWGLKQEELRKWFPQLWMPDLANRLIGIPAMRTSQVLFYNSSKAQELGFTATPTNLDEFLLQACAAAQAAMNDDDPANDLKGGWIVSTYYPVILGWIYAFGGEILKMPEPTAGHSFYQFNTNETKEAFDFLRQAFDQGCAWIPESDYPEADFVARLGLFSTGSVMDIPYYAQAFKVAENSDQWTVLPFPSTGDQGVIDIYGPSFYMFSSNPKQQLAAWLFLKHLISPQNHARLVEASGSFPLQTNELDYLSEYITLYPQWRAAVELLPLARREPVHPSWRSVRWALQDAATQLYRSYFTIDQVPLLLEYLDNFVAERQTGEQAKEAFATLTALPTQKTLTTPISSPSEANVLTLPPPVTTTPSP